MTAPGHLGRLFAVTPFCDLEPSSNSLGHQQQLAQSIDRDILMSSRSQATTMHHHAGGEALGEVGFDTIRR